MNQIADDAIAVAIAMSAFPPSGRRQRGWLWPLNAKQRKSTVSFDHFVHATGGQCGGITRPRGFAVLLAPPS
jgi:hypothetical protein